MTTRNADAPVKGDERTALWCITRVRWTLFITLLAPPLCPCPSFDNSPLISLHLPTSRLNLTKQMLIQYNSKDCLSLGINMYFISLSECLKIKLVRHSSFSHCDRLLVALNSPGIHQLSDTYNLLSLTYCSPWVLLVAHIGLFWITEITAKFSIKWVERF